MSKSKKTKPIPVRLPFEVIDQLDLVRNNTPRSEVIRLILTDFLSGKKNCSSSTNKTVVKEPHAYQKSPQGSGNPNRTKTLRTWPPFSLKPVTLNLPGLKEKRFKYLQKWLKEQEWSIIDDGTITARKKQEELDSNFKEWESLIAEFRVTKTPDELRELRIAVKSN